MAPTDSVDDADVVVLNTCCIRENADNKLYGHLGHLKSLKDQRPDLQIVVAGCLAQKDRDTIRRAGPARRRRLRHPQRAPGRRPAAPRPASRARSSRSSRRRSWRTPWPSRRRCPPAGRAGTRPGSPSRSAATTPAPSASSRRCGARRSAGRSTTSSTRSRRWSTEGVIEVTLLGQNVNCYGRDITKRRPARSPSCSGRSGPSRASAGSATPARTPRTSGPRPSRPWPRCPTVCEHLHLPLQSGSDRVLAAMHRGYTGERYLAEAGRRPGRGAPTWPSPPTSSWASPARPTTTSPAPSRWSPRPRYDSAYTFIYSPRPGTEAAERVERLRGPRRGRRSASSASGSSSSARRWPSTPPGSGRTEEVVVEGPARRDPDLTSRPHPPEQAGPLRRRRRSGPAPCADVEITGRRRPPPAGRPARGRRRAPPPPPHPGGRGLSSAPSTWSCSGPRPRASRPWPTPLAREVGDLEICSVDSMQVYRGMDIGTAKPTPGRAGRGAVPPARPGRSRPRLLPARVPGGHGRRPGRHRGPGPPGPPGRRHRPLPAGRGRRPDPAAAVPGGPGGAGGRARHRPRSTPAWPSWTRSAPPAWSRPTGGGWCGPWR